MARDDDFSPATKRLLAARAGHVCSCPECCAPTSGPQLEEDKAVTAGDAAHITAASPKGPRYNPTLSPKQRRHHNNGIWFCVTHARIVDQDQSRYTVEELRRWKQEAEAKAKRTLGRPQVPGDGLVQRENRPLKIQRTFASSIVFNNAESMPQVFFDIDSDIGQRLASKSSVARPYHNIDGKTVLMVDVPITDDQKFLHGVDALQCKMLVDICRAQRGGSTHRWSAKKGVIPTQITTPNTPEPITRLPGTAILDALAPNRFAQTGMIRLEFEYSEIPFPVGTSIRLEARPSQPGVGPEQQRVVVAVPEKATIVISIEPLLALGAGALPQGASVPEGELKDCRTFTFSVRVDAEIMRSRNHEDVIQDYKAWIEWLANELQSRNAD